MLPNYSEISALQSYIQVLERENSSHRTESITLHQHIERVSTECEQLRRQSSLKPNEQSRLLIQKQIEIVMLREGHDRWVSALQSQLDDFKRRYQLLTQGQMDGRRYNPQQQEVVHTVTYEETNIIAKVDNSPQEFLQGQLHQLQEQLEIMTTRLNHERGNLNEQHQRELERLRLEMMRPQEDWNHERNELIHQRQTMNQEITRLRKELEESRNGTVAAISGGLKVRVHEPIRIIAGNNQDDHQKRLEIEQLKTERTRLESQLSSANRTIQELCDEKAARQSVFVRLEKDNNNLHQQNTTLLRELDRIRDQKTQCTQSTVSQSEEQYIRRLQEDKLNCEADNFRLNNEIKTLREEATNLRRDISAQRANYLVENSQLRAQLQQTRFGANELKLLQARHEDQINSLVGSLNGLKEQFDRERQQLLQQLLELTQKDKANTDMIFNLTTQLERHVRVREQSKQSEGQIARLRQQLSDLKELNYQLKNSNKLQPSIDEEEYVKLLNCNHELERRVYVLENANYSLSEELTKRTRIASGKGYPSITETLNELKQEIRNYKESHVSSNSHERVERISQQTVVLQRKKVNVANPEHINIEDKDETEDKRVTVQPSHHRRQKRVSPRLSVQQGTPSRSPTDSRRVSRVGDISAKLKTIKTENEQLKRSLADMHGRSSRQSHQ